MTASLDVLDFKNNFLGQIFEIIPKEREQVILLDDFIFHKVISGNIAQTISDHLHQYLFLIFRRIHLANNIIFMKDWSKFSPENFILDYFGKDLADVLPIGLQNVNLSMESVLNNMISIVETYTSLRKIMRNSFLLKTLFHQKKLLWL